MMSKMMYPMYPNPQPSTSDVPARNTRSRKQPQCNCCCTNHCKLVIHTLGRVRQAYSKPGLALQPCVLETLPSNSGLKVMLANEEDNESEYERSSEDFDSLAQFLRSTNLETLE